MNVPYFRACIGSEEKEAVAAVLSSGWLTTGEQARKFEAACAAYLGVTHAVAVNSCTAALHLALEAIGTSLDDIVLVPTMTFAATAEVVRYMNARPVLVDCDPLTLCIDPVALEETAAVWSRRGRLRAVIPMHYGGQMADIERVAAVASRHGMQVIEDAAHAFPAFTRRGPQDSWRSVGTTSPLTCFSFYANKCITTGEGGLLVTGNAELAERVRIMSLHGLSKTAWGRFRRGGSWDYEILEAGFKYNLTDVAAALGVVQLGQADAFWRARRRVARMYDESLAPWREFIQTPVQLDDRQSSWHLYPIRLQLDRLDIERNQFIEELSQAGVGCSVHWKPLHLHAYYRDRYGWQPGDLPVATALWQRLVSLPIFPSMTDAEVEHVVTSIASVVGRHVRTSPRPRHGRVVMPSHPQRIPASKRCMDIALSLVMLGLASPLMLLVAAWVRFSSPGPILYRARRAGLGGVPFDMLKFRTMRLRSEPGGPITAANDPRVLPLGKLIRALRLDELPQIFNVLRGEMSLVGPRPEDLEIVQQCYSPEQRAVLDVLPGLAGIPQVAFLFDTRDLDSGEMDPQQHYREIILPLRLTLDLEYVHRRTLWYDMYLLGRTLISIASEPLRQLARHSRQRWARLERYDAVTR